MTGHTAAFGRAKSRCNGMTGHKATYILSTSKLRAAVAALARLKSLLHSTASTRRIFRLLRQDDLLSADGVDCYEGL
jgi:hypothetical protein